MAAKPGDNLTMSQFACKKFELGKLSGVRGKYPLELTPFFGPPMDRCASPDVDMQVVVAPAQIGKTVGFVEIPISYYIEQEPSSVMVSLADQDTSEYIAAHRMKNVFENSAELRYLYDKKTFTKNYITTKNGARVDFVWASSVAQLATKDARIIIGDEVDKDGYYVKTKEASSLSLFRERTASYQSGYFKHIFMSTPTIPTGNVLVLLQSCEVINDWHVPCPYCGVFQPLRWSSEYVFGFDKGEYRSIDGSMKPFGMVVWEGGSKADPEQIRRTSGYKCGSCGRVWNNNQKNAAVRAGIEVSRKEIFPGARNYGNHINRIYSQMDAGKITQLVKKWVDICNLPKDVQLGERQGFINSGLAEPFEVTLNISKKTDDMLVSAKVQLQPQVVPEEAVALVAFIDCQKYDFWFLVRAFAADYTSWCVHYGRLNTWDDVSTLLFDTFYPKIGSGEPVRIYRAGIDTGGSESQFENVSMTEMAYSWLRDNWVGKGCRVWGTKGANRPLPGLVKVGQPIDKTPSGAKLPEGIQIVELDTFKLKSMFHIRLKAAIDKECTQRPAYIHMGAEETYFKHITAEKLMLNPKTGKEEWTNPHQRPNHLFDCEVGCLALAEPEWPGGGIHLVNKAKQQTITSRRVLVRR